MNAVTVLLAGNPNVGKTALFNRVTGAFEREGNWHGVTTGVAAGQARRQQH